MRYPKVPSGAPLVDCARRNPDHPGQLGTGPGALDRFCNRILVHADKSGTTCSGCQGILAPDSSGAWNHAFQMNTKQEFARRLALALDHAGAPHKPIDRKRWIARRCDITERHAGNYLRGAKMPTIEGLIELALMMCVSWEWLATGRGQMTPIDLTPEEITCVRAVRSLPPGERTRLISVIDVLGRAA